MFLVLYGHDLHIYFILNVNQDIADEQPSFVVYLFDGPRRVYLTSKGVTSTKVLYVVCIGIPLTGALHSYQFWNSLFALQAHGVKQGKVQVLASVTLCQVLVDLGKVMVNVLSGDLQVHVLWQALQKRVTIYFFVLGVVDAPDELVE
jgi:hypothetical protein